jgi:hypothetical protein
MTKKQNIYEEYEKEHDEQENTSLKDLPIGKVAVLTEKEISGLKEIEEAFRARYTSPTYHVLETNYGPELFCEIYQPTLH